MADQVLGSIQIQALIDANPVDGNEYLHIKQGTADRKVTILDAMKPHTEDKNNPHGTTKYHVNLGNVTNDVQLKRDSNLSDVPSKATARTNLGVYSKTESDQNLEAHTDDMNNPHGVTKDQVGLGNVPNYTVSNNFREDADKFVSARALSALFKAIQDQYPVNSAYISFDARNPGEYLLCGGTWELTSKGQALVGYDPAVPGRAVGTTFGQSTKQITVNNLPKHTHGVAINTAPHTHGVVGQTLGSGAHAHTVTGGTSIFDYGNRTGYTDQQGSHAHTGATNASGAHRHTFGGDDQLAGFNEIAIAAVSSYDATSKFDRAANYYWTGWAGDHSHTFTTSVAGNHAHNVVVGVGAHSHSVSGNTSQIGDHAHQISFTSQATTIAVNGNTEQTGGDAPLNVEQPSMVIYIWRRTA